MQTLFKKGVCISMNFDFIPIIEIVFKKFAGN